MAFAKQSTSKIVLGLLYRIRVFSTKHLAGVTTDETHTYTHTHTQTDVVVLQVGSSVHSLSYELGRRVDMVRLQKGHFLPQRVQTDSAAQSSSCSMGTENKSAGS
jgi:hypothetical protein